MLKEVEGMSQSELEGKMVQLENDNNEFRGRLDLLGKQIAEMKTVYETVVKEIRILKEGGNI